MLRGTLDLMILQALRRGPAHGYGIAKWIREQSGDVFRVDDGALYPALRRLGERGWIAAEWGISDSQRRARYYALTSTGEAQVTEEVRSWARFSEGLWKLVRAGGGGA